MAVDPTLKAHFELLDEEDLVAHRARSDLTPEAYAALDAVLAERNLTPDRIDEIRAAAEVAVPDEEMLRYAERTYSTMRAWFFIVLLWWPVVLLIGYTFKLRSPPEIVLFGVPAAWLFTILVFVVYLARTARSLGKSAWVWVCVSVFFWLIGWIIAWAIMSDALRNMKARFKEVPAPRSVLKRMED